jgi:NADPH:quinone reductase-like Zn-dependent oxidoreductase
MSAVPSSGMLSITVPSYSNPSGYQITQCPKPVINAESDVVIKVHAASINPIDVKKADGAMKMIMKEK